MLIHSNITVYMYISKNYLHIFTNKIIKYEYYYTPISYNKKSQYSMQDILRQSYVTHFTNITNIILIITSDCREKKDDIKLPLQFFCT